MLRTLVTASFALLFLLAFVPKAQSENDSNRIELRFGPEEEFRNQKIVDHFKKRILRNLSPFTLSQKSIGNFDNLFDDLGTSAQDTKLVEEEVYKIIEKVRDHFKKKHSYSPARTYRTNHNSIIYKSALGEEKVFRFKVDQGGLEIVSTPFRLRELDKEYGRIYSEILAVLKKEGWFVTGIGGEGHVHIDLKSMFGVGDERYDLSRFRNFLVDWVNHSELYWGALHYDPKTLGALPHFLNEEEFFQFQKFVEQIDIRIKIQGSIVSHTMFESAVSELHERTDDSFTKGNALALRSETIEIRSLRPKESVEEMKRVYRLLESRLNYIARLGSTPLPLYSGVAPINRKEAIDRFYLYVAESGETWEEMKNLLPAMWRRVKPTRTSALEDLYKNTQYTPPLPFRCEAWLMKNLFY